MVVLRWAATTDVGQVRAANQDAVLAELPLFAVADGMGGHAAGEVASATALAALRSLAPSPPSVAELADGILRANEAVFDQAAGDPALRGMGTTLVALALFEPHPGEPHLALANVGDSRAYRLRAGELTQLTQDHSYVADLVAAGQITEDEALTHPNRNMLTRALGVDREVRVDAWDLVPQVGDRYLLCSDGLFNEVPPERLGELLDSIADPDELVAELVLRANASGGRDNISVVIVDVHEGDAGGGPPPVGGWLASEGLPDVGGLEVPPPPPTAPFGHDVVPTPTSPRDVARSRPAPRARRFTWRLVFFVLALAAVVAVGFVGTVWYGRNTYYVALDADQVSLFRGRPGGFLWLDPTLERRYPLATAAVPPSRLADVTEGVEFSSRGDAERYIDNLALESANLGLTETEVVPSSTTTTSTTTTSTTTTTTTSTTSTTAAGPASSTVSLG